MNRESDSLQLRTITNYLIALANEIDGVVDFGMTVCLMEDKMPHGDEYVSQRCEKIRSIVASLVHSLPEGCPQEAKNLAHWQAELAARSEQLLNAFIALRHFRDLDSEQLRSSIERLQRGWEQIHLILREIAEGMDFSDNSWYIPIQERQDVYRTTLEQLPSSFQEAAMTS